MDRRARKAEILDRSFSASLCRSFFLGGWAGVGDSLKFCLDQPTGLKPCLRGSSVSSSTGPGPGPEPRFAFAARLAFAFAFGLHKTAPSNSRFGASTKSVKPEKLKHQSVSVSRGTFQFCLAKQRGKLPVSLVQFQLKPAKSKTTQDSGSNMTGQTEMYLDEGFLLGCLRQIITVSDWYW